MKFRTRNIKKALENYNNFLKANVLKEGLNRQGIKIIHQQLRENPEFYNEWINRGGNEWVNCD